LKAMMVDFTIQNFVLAMVGVATSIVIGLIAIWVFDLKDELETGEKRT